MGVRSAAADHDIELALECLGCGRVDVEGAAGGPSGVAITIEAENAYTESGQCRRNHVLECHPGVARSLVQVSLAEESLVLEKYRGEGVAVEVGFVWGGGIGRLP